MPTLGNEERDGALLRRLKNVGHGSHAGRFGFMTGDEGARRRAMVVVARVKNGASLQAEIGALVEAGADAVEIMTGREGASNLAGSIQGLAVPCGLFVGDDGLGAAPDLSGLDWIHVDASAPARLLGGKGPTRLVGVSPALPPGRTTGLAGLKAEALVVDGAGHGGSLTLEDLMALGTFEIATKLPLLVGSGLGLTPQDVAVLHDHGVEGVLLNGDAAVVSAFVKAIESL